jgi:hypothetical protein
MHFADASFASAYVSNQCRVAVFRKGAAQKKARL